MESKRVDKLVELYEKTSKHSNYQILPDDLKKYIPECISGQDMRKNDWILSKQT